MGKYTGKSVIGKFNIDKMIDRKMETIVSEVRKNIPEVKSIILMGGYGRGEGAIEIHKGAPRLVNDFDMYIVTNKQMGDDFLEEVAMKCSKRIGVGGFAHPEKFEDSYDFNKFFHVDIRSLSERSLPSLLPSVRYYEMKNSASIIWGENSLKKFPAFEPKDIPLSEGLRLIMNRMMLLIMSFYPKFTKDKNSMSRAERDIMGYYIAKSYITMGEALLLLSGDYKPTYRGRAKEFRKVYKSKFPGLHKELPELGEKVHFFTEYKMFPRPDKVDPLKEWFICREYMGKVMKHCLEKIVKGRIPEDWSSVSSFLDKNLPKPYFMPYVEHFLSRKGLNVSPARRVALMGLQMLLNWKYYSKLRAEGKAKLGTMGLKDRGIKILHITPMVLFSVDSKGNEDKGMIRKAAKEINGFFKAGEIKNWEDLKSAYLKAYRVYYLQRFF